ncbi:MAG: hypothetical protein K8R23_04335 [Chthoniobacter sp.]|nr:hypothetical protein [Chthoniobacter sp.]
MNHAFYWNGTSMSDLGTLGGDRSFGFGISATNQISGQAALPNGAFHAFLYDGVMHDLGTLGGLESISYGMSANG